MVGTVYLFTNAANGKKYVGQTKHQKRRLQVQAQGKGSPLLSKAICKYGIENFVIEVVDTDIDTQEQLDTLEALYIAEFNTITPNGYNIRKGRLDGVKPTRLTPDQESQIIEMYCNDVKVKDISEAMGMSIGGIVKALERNNIPRRKPIQKTGRYSKIDYDLLVSLVNEGKSNTEIAKVFDTNSKYIWKYKKEKNIIQGPRETDTQ